MILRYILFIIFLAILGVSLYYGLGYFISFITDWVKRKTINWRNKQKKKFDKMDKLKK